jgi:hypothetical protein
MQKEINSIARQLFLKESLDHVSEEDLTYFISKFPYSAPARFLLARKKYDNVTDQVSDEIITAGLYFNNPLWYNAQLTTVEDVEPVPQQVETAPPVQQTVAAADKSSDNLGMEFQSYHTIDYFASQGIRLQQAELTKDKLGQQLKSFTEWLRSMKKLPTAQNVMSNPDDQTRQQVVIQDAASSIEEKEIVTETMAEVWVKQGNNAKAIEVYEKLSLLYPSKNTYFAAKIDQLK